MAALTKPASPPAKSLVGPVAAVHVVVTDPTQTQVPIYHLPNYDPVKAPQVALSFIWNNRLIGYFPDVQTTKDRISYQYQRQQELGVVL
jgi:hypothetical protein